MQDRKYKHTVQNAKREKKKKRKKSSTSYNTVPGISKVLYIWHMILPAKLLLAKSLKMNQPSNRINTESKAQP